jgi:hypothetical protein
VDFGFVTRQNRKTGLDFYFVNRQNENPGVDFGFVNRQNGKTGLDFCFVNRQNENPGVDFGFVSRQNGKTGLDFCFVNRQNGNPRPFFPSAGCRKAALHQGFGRESKRLFVFFKDFMFFATVRGWLGRKSFISDTSMPPTDFRLFDSPV